MKRLEKDEEGEVVDWCDDIGLKTTKQDVGGGMPDRVFWLPGGSPLIIEFKRRGKKPRKLQAYRIKELKELGYDTESYDNADAAKARILERLKSDKMGSASISKARSQIFIRAWRRRLVSGSRSRKDQHHTGSGESS